MNKKKTTDKDQPKPNEGGRKKESSASSQISTRPRDLRRRLDVLAVLARQAVEAVRSVRADVPLRPRRARFAGRAGVGAGGAVAAVTGEGNRGFMVGSWMSSRIPR